MLRWSKVNLASYMLTFKVAVDGGRCDVTETPRSMARGGSAALARREGCRADRWEVEVVWAGAHGNVDALRVVG